MRGLIAKFAFLFSLIGLLGQSGVASAARRVEAFGMDTWSAIAQGATPKVIVFSTTDCVHCPKAIGALAKSARRSPRKPELVVVVMDGAGMEAELLASPNYLGANRLFVFAGDDTQLRYAVNPEWRGLTPYVALISAGQAPRFFAGLPPLAASRAFFQTPLSAPAR
ncbi:MAG: hypothetical protein WBK19_13520 [Azonexus sp.]